ncbi:MAG: hypothetical protein WA971_10750, partial [Microbacterium sp.]
DRDARGRAWIGYGVAVALCGTFFLYLLLMPVVHLTVLLVSGESGRRSLRRWWTAMAVGGVLSLPIVVISQFEKGQIGFLAVRNYVTPSGVFVTPWFVHLAPALVLWPLVLAGVVAVGREWRRGSARGRAFLPLVAWLVFPALALLLIHVLITPTYNPRYLSFCLGAVAILVAGGVWAFVDLARRIGGRTAVGIVTVLLVAAGSVGIVPELVHERTPFAKDGGADFRFAADDIGARANPGDTVLFGTGGRPSRAPRLAYRLYPDRFAGLSDPQLITSYDRTSGLWDRLATVSEIAHELDGHTVWLIEDDQTGSAADDLRALTSAGYTQIDRTVIHRSIVYEFQKGSRP